MSSTPPDPYQQVPGSQPAPPPPPPPAAPGTAYQAPTPPPPAGYQDYVQPPGPGGYGPPPQPGYGAYQPGPYAGYPGAPMAPAGAWGYPYAHWGHRVVAVLIDFLYTLPGVVLAIIGTVLVALNTPTRNRSGTVMTTGNTGLVTFGVILLVIGWLACVCIGLYNLIIVQGRSGQSWGKRHIGLRIVHEHTGAPLSMGMNFVRYLCHYIDGILYLGYLWPLWDPKRQTFADKIMTTVVLKER